MKKIIIIVLSFLTLFLITFMSLRTSNINFTVTDSPAEKVELVMWIQESFAGSETYFNELTTKFEKFYPNVNITYEIIKGSDYRTYKYITNHLINGNTPDLYLLSVSNYNTLATQSELMDLSAYNHIYDSLITSAYENSGYNDGLYGIAYFLDPEVLVYNIHHKEEANIEIPEGFDSTSTFLTYMGQLNTHLLDTQKTYTGFSIPSMISNGEFIGSLDIVNDLGQVNRLLFNRLKSLHSQQHVQPYYYNKDIDHPFFSNATLFSIEPLSLVYEQINSNYSMNESIGVVPLHDSGLKFSYSQSHYISISKATNQPELAGAFLELFLSETEIRNRYKYYNVPVIAETLKEEFIKDSSYNNSNIWGYLESAFHNKISATTTFTNSAVDQFYNGNINDQLVICEEQ